MHRSKKPSSQRIWSAWGDWIWSQTQSRYYSQRQDTYGEIETRWGPVYDTIPRDDRQEDLVGVFQNAHLGDGDDEEYQDNPSYPLSQPSHGGQNTAAYAKSSSKRDDKKKRDRKGKGKSYQDKGDGDYDAAYPPGPDDDAGDTTQGQGVREPAEDEHYSHRGKSTRGFSPPPTRSPYANPGPSYPDVDEIYDDGYAAAVHASRAPYNPGESSSRAEQSYDEARSDSYRTGMTNDYIRGAENELDLDPRYRIQPSYKFQPGEVFKVLWPEPAGGASGKAPSLSDKKEVRDNYGGSIFVGFRRFIVVANDSGHCTCVPIATYGGKACKKKGIKPEKHGIITEKGVKSKRLDGEPKLGFPTVRVKIYVEGERLARESRVNYSKIVTVEHNVKVFFIGSIHGEDYEHVVEAVNNCWEKKNFYKKRH